MEYTTAVNINRSSSVMCSGEKIMLKRMCSYHFFFAVWVGKVGRLIIGM